MVVQGDDQNLVVYSKFYSQIEISTENTARLLLFLLMQWSIFVCMKSRHCFDAYPNVIGRIMYAVLWIICKQAGGTGLSFSRIDYFRCKLTTWSYLLCCVAEHHHAILHQTIKSSDISSIKPWIAKRNSCIMFVISLSPCDWGNVLEHLRIVQEIRIICCSISMIRNADLS